MRILFWTDHFWPYVGGPEILSTKLLPALGTRGYKFTVVTSHDYLELPDKAYYHDIPVYRLPFRKALANRDVDQWIKARRDITRLKKACAPDLVHVNGVGPGTIFNFNTADADRSLLLVTLHTLHGELEHAQNGTRGTLLEKTLNSASWVNCVSQAVLRDARKNVPEITARSSVIYNGLEAPSIFPKPLPFDAPYLLCLGRLVAVKGFDLAVSAFSALVDRFPNARLIIAGDGPMRPILQEQVSKLGLNDFVEFTCWVAPDKVPELINRATIVLMPSRREGLPLVGIEAALMARPIVATHIGGLPEIVLHEETGLLVERDDVSSLTQAIELLLNNPDRARQLGEAARRRAQEMFSLECCINSYDALYRSIAEGSSYAGRA